MRILYYVDIAVFFVLAANVVARVPSSPASIIGLTMAAAGFVFWMLARVQLGSSFAVTAKAKALVTTGLYAKFRHPVYVFGGVAFTGLFVAWNVKWAAPYLLFYCVFQWLRTRNEDAVLEQAFGEEYRQYKARTWF